MALKKRVIRLQDDGLILAKIPNLIFDLRLEYPQDWFDAHPNHKLCVRIPRFKQGKYELWRRMGSSWSTDTNIEPTLAFLHEYILAKFRDRLLEANNRI